MTIIHNNILDWAAHYEGEPFHALLCDPPYHLTDPRNPARAMAKSPTERKAKGFMQMAWDGLDENGQRIAFQPDTWAALAQHLYPGAFGMAFAGTRGYHRMACAIEDAGLILHPAIGWVFGSGFPKATRVKGADAFQGHRYGLQALKPAFEFVALFQKPYAGRPVDCITATGAGALNVEAGRIGTADQDDYGRSAARSDGTMNPGLNGYGEANRSGHLQQVHEAGRWPANFALVHAPLCTDVCDAACPVRRLGEQGGELTSGARNASERKNHDQGWHMASSSCESSSGTAARFFHNSDWMLERLEAADAVGYFAKASTTEREAGLDPLQVALTNAGAFDETTVSDGRAKSIDNPYQRGETTRRNTHPTIKPLELSRWLASLLLPPAEYGPRRLLVPFAGAGSEMIGAMFAGWEEITGIELEAKHVAIARARLAYWQQQKHRFDGGQPIAVKATSTNEPTLFDLMEAA